MKDINHLAAAINAQKKVIDEAKASTNTAITALEAATTAINERTKLSERKEVAAVISQLSAALTHLRLNHGCENRTIDQLNEYLASIGYMTSIPEDEVIQMIENNEQDAKKSATKPENTIKRIGITSGEIEQRSKKRDLPEFDPEIINYAAFQGVNPYHKVDTAEANLFFNEGVRWNNEPLRAHYDNLKVNAEGVIKKYSEFRSIWHIEGAIARFMRNNKVKEVCVYLNVQACSARDGCSGNLQHLMPKDSVAYLQYLMPIKNSEGKISGYKPRIRKVIGTGKYLETLHQCGNRRPENIVFEEQDQHRL